MNKEINKGSHLVPLEEIAISRNADKDKATRRMIVQAERTIFPRFQLEASGTSLEHQNVRYIEFAKKADQNMLFRAAVRSSDSEYVLDPDLPVSIITGMCLFGASGLTGVTESGRHISLTDPYELKKGVGERLASVTELSLLHPSEAETLLRLTGVINGLVAVDKSGGSEMDCTFHQPAPEYILYMLDLHAQGVLSDDQLITCSDAIIRRTSDLQKLIKKRIACSLSFGSPLDSLLMLFNEKGLNVSLDECIARLRKDPFFEVLIDVGKPKTFIELASLSYSAGYVLISKAAKDQERSCLAVEIAEEMPILKFSKNLGDAMNLPIAMAALYVPPMILTKNGRNGKQALFMHEPSGERTISSLQTVMKSNKRRM